MKSYVLKRLLSIIPTLLGITLVSFFVMHLAPGAPTDLVTDLNPKVSLEAKKRLTEMYGLDKPLPEQYINWLGRVVRLDFGQSFSTDRRPVWDKIKERLPVTLTLNILSLIIIMGVAIPVGVYASVKPGGWFDKSTTLFVFIAFAAPSFWLALLAMKFFGAQLGILPISGLTSLNFHKLSFTGKILDYAWHLILPVTLSAIGGLAGMSRYMRANMVEVLGQDYIRTARAKGLSERRVVLRHGLKNALMPVITILGLSVPGLIGGSVIMESIFSIPGLGQLFYNAVISRDYPTVMGGLVLGAFLTLIGNLLADIGYAWADPRVRDGLEN